MYREQRHGRHADGEREREDFRPVTRHLVIERIFRLEPRRFHDDEYDAQPDAQRRTVFIQLNSQRVLLEGMILKPNMVLPGLTCPTQGSVDEVANITVKSLWRTVPAAVPGIAFLSGGQSAELASARLNTMNLRFKSKLPWALAFFVRPRHSTTGFGDLARQGRQRVVGTASPASSRQVQPRRAPWRIHCRDGKDISMTTSN